MNTRIPTALQRINLIPDEVSSRIFMVQVCNGAVQDAEGKQTARKAGRCLRKGSVLQNRGDAFLQLTWY